MISKINIWAQGIVIATIIATVIQLILPENKNKKYIKVVIGIYILFCIIHPVVGKTVNLNDYNIEDLSSNGNFIGHNKNIGSSDTGSENNYSQNGAYQYNKSINDEFEKGLINDVKTKLNSMGYSSDNIDVSFDKDYNIKHLKILAIKKYNNDESINVKDVNISLNNGILDEKDEGNNSNNDHSEIRESEKVKIKNYFSETYKVDKNEIEVE